MALDSEKKRQIIDYIREQIAQADFRADAYVLDDAGKKRPTRNIYIKLNRYLNEFLSGKHENRLIILTGLRGAGKTTLLSQLFIQYKTPEVYSLFLSVDQIVQILEISLYDFLSVFEQFIGKTFEQLDKPLLLFLDEVQYEGKWGVILKSIFDRSRKVFVMATGSSALHLNTNADITRRAIIERLSPMSFSEYLKIKFNKFEIKGLAAAIRQYLFESASAGEVYSGLNMLEPKINSYLSDINRPEVENYIRYGTLPFMVAINNESLIYDKIEKNVERIISMDIAPFSNFSSEIVSRIPAVLYAIADADVVVLSNLAPKLDISRPKLMEIFDILEKTETTVRVYPHGGHYSQTNKPSKYLFSSPAFRSMYFNTIGSVKKREDAMGKLLEDTVGMYLTRYFGDRTNVAITYDPAAGGADFIVSQGDNRIILEVGMGEKGFAQIANTGKKVPAKYGLVVAEDRLFLSEKDNSVRIPLEYFLLI
ncbi:ATP-binding protein [Candidatus Saganbacteria bacterium]|nr:ATP-binding protein [Candidatus Saganbacteria bacterium]